MSLPRDASLGSAKTLQRAAITEFLALTASKAPTPGGGSCAAVATALSAALIEKVAGKAQKRNRSAAPLCAQARIIRLRATRAIQADAQAYLRVVTASRRKNLRALVRALRSAARVPQGVAHDARTLGRLSQRLLTMSSPVWRSDVVCAHDLAQASERASLGFVYANRAYLKQCLRKP